VRAAARYRTGSFFFEITVGRLSHSGFILVGSRPERFASPGPLSFSPQYDRSLTVVWKESGRRQSFQTINTFLVTSTMRTVGTSAPPPLRFCMLLR
jgi:hypothetical protein